MLTETSEFLAFLRENPGGTIMKSEITFLQYQDGSIDDFVEQNKKNRYTDNDKLDQTDF